MDDYENAILPPVVISAPKGEMSARSQVSEECAVKQLERVDNIDTKQAERTSEEDDMKIISAREDADGLSSRRSQINDSEEMNEEHGMKKRSAYQPEIELGMWPKLIHLPGTSSNVLPQRLQPCPAKQQKMYHRPWETTRRERCDNYPARGRPYWPMNRFITTEFGHLGVRNQAFSNEDPQCTLSRPFCQVEHEGEWIVGPSHSYATYYGHGRGYVPVQRECYSCNERHERYDLLLQGRRHHRLGPFDPQMIAANQFRTQHPQHEQEAAKPVQRSRHSTGENEGEKKRVGLTTYWPKISSEDPGSGRMKGQRVTSSSPTFEYICTNKAKDSKERPFNCTICEKSFKRRSSLATHKSIHTDLKPHVCGVCNKRFLRKSDLKKHGLMHSGMKPYACKECGRRFSQSSNMLTHLRRHKGIRPFQCMICNRSFFRKVDLKRHEGRHIAKTHKAIREAE